MSLDAGKADPYARKAKRYYETMSASSLGIQLALSIVLGLGAGYWADRKLGTEPWLLIAGLVYGCIAAGVAVVDAHRRVSQQSPDHSQDVL